MLTAPLLSLIVLAAAPAPSAFPKTALKPACAEAKTRNRLVLAEVWTFGSEPSRSYRENVLSRPPVLAWLQEHAVGARLNVDFNAKLKKQFFVREVPTVLLLDGDARVWGRITGPERAPALVEKLEEARKDRLAFYRAQKILQESPADPKALLALFRGYLRTENARTAEATLMRLRQADPEKKVARHEQLAFDIAASIYEPRRDLKNSIRVYQLAATWARGENQNVRRSALFRIANLKLAAGEPEKTVELLELLLEESGRFPERSKALYVLGLTYVRELNQPEKGIPHLKRVRDRHADRFSLAAEKLLESLEDTTRENRP